VINFKTRDRNGRIFAKIERGLHLLGQISSIQDDGPEQLLPGAGGGKGCPWSWD
jgi:hypothetical protein